MPARQKALYFNGTSQYLKIPNFNPTKSKDKAYSLVCGFNKSTPSSNFDPNYGDIFFSKRDTLTCVIYGNANDRIVALQSGVGAFNKSFSSYDDFSIPQLYAASWRDGIPGQVQRSSFKSYANLSFTESSPDGNITYSDISSIGGDTYIWADDKVTYPTTRFGQGYLSYYAFFKGWLANKDIMYMYNNSLFKNPSLSIQRNPDYSLELFIDFNNPYQVDSSLYFKDLSPNNHTVEAIGWANLNDLQNSLVSLCELRGGTPITEFDYWVDEDYNPILDEKGNYILVP
jgi:hypothetical protein